MAETFPAVLQSVEELIRKIEEVRVLAIELRQIVGDDEQGAPNDRPPPT